MKNRYEIRGDITVIFLNRKDGSILETVIDTKDLARANEYNHTWYAAARDDSGKLFYVFGGVYDTNKRKTNRTVSLHRWLFGDIPKGIHIDHIDSDGLNNRSSTNLRKVTNAQNQQNKRVAMRNSASGIRGVSWHKKINRWRVQVGGGVGGKSTYIGSFKDIRDAEKAAIEARKKIMPFYTETKTM